MEHQELLVQAGFSQKEARLYLCLLRMGELPLSNLSKQTGILRTTVYSLVQQLEMKGFVSITQKNKINTVAALKPELLVKLLKNDLHDKHQKLRFLEKALPKLTEITNKCPIKPKIRSIEGTHALDELIQEFLDSPLPKLGFAPSHEHLNTSGSCRNEVHTLAQTDPVGLFLYQENQVALISFMHGETFGCVIDSQLIYSTLDRLLRPLKQLCLHCGPSQFSCGTSRMPPKPIQKFA
jgi:predicted DNA-binding transcriptional regulator